MESTFRRRPDSSDLETGSGHPGGRPGPRRVAAWFALFSVLAGFDLCYLESDKITEVMEIKNFHSRSSDSDLYRAVIRRVGRGEDYYAVASEELSGRGYPTGSVFNWRLPTYAWVFGIDPSLRLVRWLLVGCVLLSVSTAVALLRHQGGVAMKVMTAVGLTLSYGWVWLPNPPYFTELWSGLLVFLSVCLIATDHGGWGVGFAAVALAFRELALPYVCIAVVVACLRRRWGTRLGLILTIVAFLLWYHLHVRCVGHHAEFATPDSSAWVAVGGIPFILSTCRANFLLAAFPVWFTAAYLPLSLLGLLGWKGREFLMPRAVAIGYLLIFAVVGRPYNHYWGWMYMLFLMLGFLRSPLVLRSLLIAAAG